MDESLTLDKLLKVCQNFRQKYGPPIEIHKLKHIPKGEGYEYLNGGVKHIVMNSDDYEEHYGEDT